MTAASRITVRDFQKMKADGTPIAMLTAYDETSARLGELAGVTALLVGDSLGMVIQGHQTPLPVTLDHIIYHAQIVTRVTTQSLVIGDMPFMTYNISPEQALANAGRLVQASGVGAVKMEGGVYLAPTIARIVQAGIPVMGTSACSRRACTSTAGCVCRDVTMPKKPAVCWTMRMPFRMPGRSRWSSKACRSSWAR
jgi:3-methyl-2-oxobutanoate hydroxymethyltransferase